MIQPWLQAHLEATGRWNVDGIARTLSATTCRTCGAQILTGLDADRAALPIAADPDPIDNLGELTAILTGRTTLNLIHTGGRKWTLTRRHKWNIAGERKHPILAQHECWKPLGTPDTTQNPARTPLPEKAPF